MGRKRKSEPEAEDTGSDLIVTTDGEETYTCPEHGTRTKGEVRAFEREGKDTVYKCLACGKVCEPATPDRQPGDKPKLRQQYFDGMEPPRVKEIDRAAESYVEVRNEWQTLGVTMAERKEKLHALMTKHQLKNYAFDGMEVEVTMIEGVKVRKAKAESTNGDGHDDGE
jgi:hypothetical protein